MRLQEGICGRSFSVVLVAVLATGNIIRYEFNAKTKPVAAVEFLKNEHIKGNMFDNDEFGDYIIYEAWPEYKVFVDGRSDMYGVDIMKEYLKVVSIKPGWDEVFKKVRCQMDHIRRQFGAVAVSYGKR